MFRSVIIVPKIFLLSDTIWIETSYHQQYSRNLNISNSLNHWLMGSFFFQPFSVRGYPMAAVQQKFHIHEDYINEQNVVPPVVIKWVLENLSSVSRIVLYTIMNMNDLQNDDISSHFVIWTYEHELRSELFLSEPYKICFAASVDLIKGRCFRFRLID